MTTPRSKELRRELGRMRGEGADDAVLTELAVTWGGRVERRYLHSGQITGVALRDAVSVLEGLCARNWAERGLRLSCQTCGLVGFVGLHDSTSAATCPGCRSDAGYEAGDGLVMYYRLDSYLDRLSDQGVLLHLLTIAALQKSARNCFFLPGVNVWVDASSKNSEADIFGIRDGKILCGEIRTSATEFSVEQIKRDVELTKRLGADAHVMAATDDIPEDVIKAARSSCTEHGLDLIDLGRSDLIS